MFAGFKELLWSGWGKWPWVVLAPIFGFVYAVPDLASLLDPDLGAKLLASAKVFIVYAPWLIVLLTLFYFFRLLWMIRERDKLADDILAPKVAIDFDNGGYYEETKNVNMILGGGLDPKKMVPRTIRTFRVGLRNTGVREIPKVSVRLDDLIDEVGNRQFQCPVALQRIEGQGPCPLQPEAPKFAIVATMLEGTPPDSIKIHCLTSRAGHPIGYQIDDKNLSQDRSYTLTIGLYPDNGRPARRTFKLWVDEEKVLRFEPTE